MEVFGLPVHPLVVHAAVVFVPVTMVAAVIISFSQRARVRFGSATLVLSGIALVSVIAAMVSGNALKAELPAVSGVVQQHESFGSGVIWPTIVVVMGIALVLIGQHVKDRTVAGLDPAVTQRRGRQYLTVGVVVNLAAAVTGLVLVVLAGHSGASAVWG